MIRHCSILICTFTLVLQFGCDDPPEIRQYEVAKERSDLGDIGKEPLVEPKMEPKSSSPTPTRMVVAISERKEATWFFKLTGPIKAVNAQEQQWTKLLASITFDDNNKPTWETPEGWLLGPAKQMRFATLITNVKDLGTIELSISNLSPNQNLLDNVNRWLGQLDKPAIEEANLKLEPLESKSGTMQIFDATGVMVLDSMPVPQNRPREPELTHQDLKGWSKGNVNDIVKVRLRKGDERTAPQITVTQLLAAANSWVPNAQRWARQVGMDESEDYARENSTKITVDGIEGDKIRLIPEDKEAESATIGIMIHRENLAWFFKIFGDREKVIELENDFDAFVESFRFK